MVTSITIILMQRLLIVNKDNFEHIYLILLQE